LRNTPILSNTTGDVNMDQNTGDFAMGVNPNIDPELYQALQESRSLYEQSNQSTQNPSSTSSTSSTSNTTSTSSTTNTASTTSTTSGTNQNVPPTDNDGDVKMYDDDIEEAIRLSLQTSKIGDDNPPPNETTTQTETSTPITNAESTTTNANNAVTNQENQNIDMSGIGTDFLRDVLQNLEGVNINDPSIQNLLSTFNNDQKNDDKDNKDNKDKKDN